MTLTDLDRVIEAINALRTMRDTKEPRRLDEALTWRANDELAERMADDALTLLRQMRENAVEGWVRGDTDTVLGVFFMKTRTYSEDTPALLIP